MSTTDRGSCAPRPVSQPQLTCPAAVAGRWPGRHWPATLSVLGRIRPVATVNFSADLLVDPLSVAADEALLHHGTASGAHAGFTSEQRRLWTADGRLAVDNLQSTVLIA